MTTALTVLVDVVIYAALTYCTIDLFKVWRLGRARRVRNTEWVRIVPKERVEQDRVSRERRDPSPRPRTPAA